MVYLTAIAMGFIVALITGVFLGGRKAVSLPGGSFGAGMSVGFLSSGSLILCGILGIVGWLLYTLLYNWLNTESNPNTQRPIQYSKYLYASAKVMDTRGNTLMHAGDTAKVIEETFSYYVIGNPHRKIRKDEPNIEVWEYR